MSCPLRPPSHLLYYGQGLPSKGLSRDAEMDSSDSNATGLSPEAAQDDHGSGEGDERCAVANCVEGLHRQVVIILQQGTGHAGLCLGPVTAP